jgi:nucleoside-diphosphate-sugar epimerase
VRFLVTGALGQIGTELTQALRARHGADAVLATDVRPAAGPPSGPFSLLDARDRERLGKLARDHEATWIIHLAALLSASGEANPELAWDLNIGSLRGALEVARELGCGLFVPSSIAAFGPGTPAVDTPQVTVQRPTTIYGITKVTGELLCDWYFARLGVDTRGLRFPGLISHSAPPGGGTTDYAVEIFEAALRHGTYACPLSAETRLDMMYMPDAIDGVIKLLEAEGPRLVNRNAYNISAMSFTPAEIAAAIREHLPNFTLTHAPDPVRQRIADSWPDRMDDRAARAEWGWSPRYDLPAMVAEMLARTEERLARV